MRIIWGNLEDRINELTAKNAELTFRSARLRTERDHLQGRVDEMERTLNRQAAAMDFPG